MNVKEIRMDGIDWVLISAIPKSIFMSDINSTMHWAGLIASSLLFAILVYNLLMAMYLKPLKSLLQISVNYLPETCLKELTLFEMMNLA